MKTFLIKTLGCKVNQCESEAIGNALLESDAGLTPYGDGMADLVIVNTCTVTRKAAMQSRQAIRRAIRENPAARIVVTGCHAQTAATEVAAIEGVDLVVGNREKHLITRHLFDNSPTPALEAAPAGCSPVGAGTRFEVFPGIAHGTRTRPFLKIQDGCNAFCTYCIVPHARGRSRSLPMDQALHQIGRLGRMGYHEVVLTGIHVGCYGQDLIPPTGLVDLLDGIRDAGSIDRVRLSSIEPAELSDDIISLADADPDLSGRLCPHFHIPLQSGDDVILKRMHRPYTRDYFRDRVETIIHRLPEAAIGVDVLIGFPGETDDAFENTYTLIRSLPVAYLHVFPFSAREGTPAFSFKNQVPIDVIKRRCQRMRRLGVAKRLAFYKRYVGRRITVLVEGTRERGHGHLKGLSDNYLPVHIDGPDSLFNTFRQVTLRHVSADGTLKGEVG
jgi:threonylcarbamoyladenosine tRNA methylthiotransferase MtaB